MPLVKCSNSTHPYLTLGQIKDAKKLILGSFPVYECTNDDHILKQQKRDQEGTIKFFYGSNRNSLWELYKRYIEPDLQHPWNPLQILKSTSAREIAISDTILSCERCGYKKNKQTGLRIEQPYSSEDSALLNKTWNKEALSELILGGVTKILCTSKGVLKDLESKIICCGRPTLGQVDDVASQAMQSAITDHLEGNSTQIAGPIARVFIVNEKIIQTLAVPSPGSAQRQLATFGFDGTAWKDYANRYFSAAFRWLIDEQPF